MEIGRVETVNNVLASTGRFCKFSKLDLNWVECMCADLNCFLYQPVHFLKRHDYHVHVLNFLLGDARSKLVMTGRKMSLMFFTGMCFGQDKLVWFHAWSDRWASMQRGYEGPDRVIAGEDSMWLEYVYSIRGSWLCNSLCASSTWRTSCSCLRIGPSWMYGPRGLEVNGSGHTADLDYVQSAMASSTQEDCHARQETQGLQFWT